MADYKYRIVLSWSDRDNAWIAQVPDLPGCLADGATPSEAVANAQIIIGEWIETAREDGLPIPEPRLYDVRQTA